jgi:endonuclease/exonuclease/phosphatase family metal-dependent hydrolase
VIEWLRAEAFDLVALQEATPGWRRALSNLNDLYPHRAFLPLRPDASPDAFGLGLLSRHPIRDARFESPGDRRRPWLECRVEIGGRELQVVVVHPSRPGRADTTERRDRGLLAVVDAVPWTERAVLLGDLNTSSFSPVFEDLLSGAGLADSRARFGRLPTWPASLPELARIDLDHVLVRPGIGVLERGVGPELGSDHVPATATLVFRAGVGSSR